MFVLAQHSDQYYQAELMGQESTVASDGGGGGDMARHATIGDSRRVMDFKVNDWSVYDCKLGVSNEGRAVTPTGLDSVTPGVR